MLNAASDFALIRKGARFDGFCYSDVIFSNADFPKCLFFGNPLYFCSKSYYGKAILRSFGSFRFILDSEIYAAEFRNSISRDFEVISYLL